MAVAPDPMIAVAAPARACGQLVVLLQPLSHPELGAIRVQDSVFAIGRTEAPFDTYPSAAVAELSRRHGRIFCERGAAFFADLDSKNGSAVNGKVVRQAVVALHDGDELALGAALRYRVALQQDAAAAPRAATLASVTLTPEPEPELGPGVAQRPAIVVSEFPFLVSKTDPVFARAQGASAQQLNYLSRRHAHLFLNGGQPFVEDLGSTNGTFVDGERLDEHARALHEGTLLAFGGHYFVYRIGLQWRAVAPDPTLTRIGALGAAAPVPVPPDADKTTFVAAADSFLDIFCVDPADAGAEASPPDAPAEAQEGRHAGGRARAGTRVGAWLDAVRTALARSPGLRRGAAWGGAALAMVLVASWSLYQIGAPEREVTALLAGGAYARAAALAGAQLARDPDNARLKALGLEALLKANLPAWIAALKARQFGRAAAIAASMRQPARLNPELAPLLAELDWMLALEATVAARGGALAPVRDAADAAAIARSLAQWEEQNEAHQRAFVTMAAQVPAFRDAYADALSDARKLALTAGRAYEPGKP